VIDVGRVVVGGGLPDDRWMDIVGEADGLAGGVDTAAQAAVPSVDTTTVAATTTSGDRRQGLCWSHTTST
jgi:hypothetical protein